ncbi:MAG: glucosamine-6-phosphate deaminase, partial [Alphaproteobacteria bacterium]|nr:glucosamine-6-phosphate deaminase [Alphaproteobacteria bacterium]
IAKTSPDNWKEQTEYAGNILRLLEEKGAFGEDTPALRQLKGLILRGELRDAAQALGLSQDKVVFLDLPFYEKGRYRRFQLAQEDHDAVKNLLSKFKPHQIYLTGAASDPSSVSALTYRALQTALGELQHEDWSAMCSVWLYRGKEKSLEPWEIDMAIPLSPNQLERKARALTRYQSLTSMEKEITHANQSAAAKYDALGLANYEAMESFQRWRNQKSEPLNLKP